jgi:hypothetical protein
MALLIWCLGIATIYPPGALTVTLEAHNSITSHNMSVMNPPIPLNYSDIPDSWNSQDALNFPTLGSNVYQIVTLGIGNTGVEKLEWFWSYV